MPHGFSAKVSDFGMAREMDIQSKIATATTGTVTYMPPETIADGMVSKVSACMACLAPHSSQGLCHTRMPYCAALKELSFSWVLYPPSHHSCSQSTHHCASSSHV